FWKALYAAPGAWWRVSVGVLLGLAFVEKMAAVLVVLPLLGWLVCVHLPRAVTRGHGRAAWVDGLTTSVALLAPLVLVAFETVRVARLLPPPAQTDLFVHRVQAIWPGGILACPLALWIIRRLAARTLRGHPVWGVERPALETWAAALAFAP